MNFVTVTLDGYPPAYVVIGWMTLCVPVILLIASFFLRSSPQKRTGRLSQTFFFVCHAQFLLFVCAQMADLLLNVVFRFRHEFAEMSAAHLAMLWLTTSHTLLAVDLQLFVTCVSGVGIALLLHRHPATWKPIPSIIGMTMVAAAQVVACAMFTMMTN